MGPSFHLYLPQMRMSHDRITERAVVAEANGFEGIAFMDHLAPPLALDQDMWEAMTTASWVLARTSTLRVGHLVLCDSLRHPALLARQVTSLDHASGGRFELGIGWGSVPAELATYGIGTTDARARVARMGETLEILAALWSGEPVDFAGEHFTLTAAQQRPVPLGAVPITIGGVGPRTLELVRAHADWWNVPVHSLHRMAEVRHLAGSARVSTQQMVALVESEAERETWTSLVNRRYAGTQMLDQVVVGTADELTAFFAERAAQGVERFYVWFADFAPPATLVRFSTIIDRLA